MEKLKLIRIANIPSTINNFCKGLLKKLSTEYEVIAVASPGPEMKIIEEREGVRTVSIPVERPISILKDIVSLYRIFFIPS